MCCHKIQIYLKIQCTQLQRITFSFLGYLSRLQNTVKDSRIANIGHRIAIGVFSYIISYLNLAQKVSLKFILVDP